MQWTLVNRLQSSNFGLPISTYFTTYFVLPTRIDCNFESINLNRQLIYPKYGKVY
jgi:hypothetical protein